MTSDRSREAAYADLVAGLLDLRTDPATERFDAELAAAEEEGRIDAQTAKVLRWWQRESLRTMVEHASSVVPPTMLALERAATGSEHEVQASARSWARAGSQPDADARRARRPPAQADSHSVRDCRTRDGRRTGRTPAYRPVRAPAQTVGRGSDPRSAVARSTHASVKHRTSPYSTSRKAGPRAHAPSPARVRGRAQATPRDHRRQRGDRARRRPQRDPRPRRARQAAQAGRPRRAVLRDAQARPRHRPPDRQRRPDRRRRVRRQRRWTTCSSHDLVVPRPAIGSIMVRTSGPEAEALVSVAATGGHVFEGRMVGPGSATHRCRLVAQATLNALEELLGSTADVESSQIVSAGAPPGGPHGPDRHGATAGRAAAHRQRARARRRERGGRPLRAQRPQPPPGRLAAPAPWETAPSHERDPQRDRQSTTRSPRMSKRSRKRRSRKKSTPTTATVRTLSQER